MATDKAKRTSISVLRSTKDVLDSMKHPGQSCDGLIQELINLWRKEHGVEETREKERR